MATKAVRRDLSMPRKYELHAARIAVTYALTATLWIIASDAVVQRIPLPPEIHPYKGAAFVAATACLLYAVLRRAAGSIRTQEAELFASREQFRLVVENAPEGIFIQSGGIFRYANPSALAIFGAHANDLLGSPVLDRIHPDDRETVLTRMRILAEQPLPVPPVVERFLRLDGTSVDVEVSAAPFIFHGERGVLVFARDITERKKADEEKRLLEEQVRQAQKLESIGRLAGGVAHDFNNLLTIINGYCDVILMDLPEGNTISDSLREIRDAGERAASLTRQLLAFSRKDIAERTAVDLNLLIRDLEKMLGRLVGEHIHVRTSLAAESITVLADPSALNQVIMNLVVNSRDAMPSGGEIVISTGIETLGDEVRLQAPGAPPGQYVRMSVGDTGSGIDPAIQKQIFEPFFTTKRSGEGTGLGLSTVYGIVKNSDGWITVASQLQAGTTMTIWLPVYNGSPTLAAARTTPALLRGNETILLVEDDAAVRQTTEKMLKTFGYNVLTAPGGAEALIAAAGHAGRIHLLLADVMMPQMTGPELADRLLQISPDTKVILMSGYRADLESGESAARQPGFPFISKPFSNLALGTRIRFVLDQTGQ